MNKKIKKFTLVIKNTVNIWKHTSLKTSEIENDNKTKCNQGKQN